PGLWNVVDRFAEENHVVPGRGDIGKDVGLDIAVFAGAAIALAPGGGFAYRHRGHVNARIVAIATRVELVPCIAGPAAQTQDASVATVFLDKRIYPGTGRMVTVVP